MAARINKPLHAQKTKDLIRASQLLNRLTAFAKGEVELSAAQVQAARIVIGKEIPDKKAIEHSTDPNKPFQARIEVVIVDAP